MKKMLDYLDSYIENNNFVFCMVFFICSISC